MTLRARRLLYITCIIIFILIAPPLVLYTAGWRYDFTYNRLVETGSLVIKSTPAKADIFLDNKPYQEKTPTIINDILPGKINLEVKKDGYHPWEKTVAIGPRLTTFAESIKLFLQSEPKVLISGSIKQYWWNRKQDKIAYLTNKGQLRLYNTLSGKDTFLANVAVSTLQNVSWSPHDDQLLVSRGTQAAATHFIINAAATEKFINLNQITNLALTDLQWDQASSNTLYGLAGGALYRIPYLLKTTRLVLPGPLLSYSAGPDRIAFIEKLVKARAANLSWISVSDPTVIHRLTIRLDPSHDTLVKTNSRLVAINNSREKTLTIIDPSVKTDLKDSVIEIPNAQKSIWSVNGDKLIYTEAGAIYQRTFIVPLTVIPRPNSSELITRYSQPLQDIFWSDDESYLFYSVEDTLRVLEIGPAAEPRSLTLLEKAANIKQPEFINSPKLITFIDESGALQALPIAAKEDRAFLFGD